MRHQSHTPYWFWDLYRPTLATLRTSVNTNSQYRRRYLYAYFNAGSGNFFLQKYAPEFRLLP